MYNTEYLEEKGDGMLQMFFLQIDAYKWALTFLIGPLHQILPS